jgi:hypothetical protein
MHRLEQLAGNYSYGQYDPYELINETVARVLEGRRHRPSDVHPIAFLAMVMKSISKEWTEQRARHPIDVGTALVEDKDGGALLTVQGVTTLTPEREISARRVLDVIRQQLASDARALAVFDGRAEGRTPAEIRDSACLDETQYDSANKKIYRLLKEVFPYGFIL